VLNEVERNLTDAIGVTRNVALEPKLLPGGGACEMAVSKALQDKADTIEGVEQWPYRAVAVGLEVIPRTLAQNCGINVIRTLTKVSTTLETEHRKSTKRTTSSLAFKIGPRIEMEKQVSQNHFLIDMKLDFESPRVS
jgi:T-complex protein 1 subunit gamma